MSHIVESFYCNIIFLKMILIFAIFFLQFKVYDMTKRNVSESTFCGICHKRYLREHYCECECHILMYNEETSE